MPNIVKPSGINLLWAAGGTKVDPGQAKTNIGWVVELPPYQYQNWLDNRQDTFIAHINQHGIAEWDAETEYQGGLSYTQGSDGKIYKCTQTNTNRNPTNPVNNIYWVVAFESFGAVAVVQTALNTHIANYQTLTGLSNTTVARNNLGVYSKAESDTRFAAVIGNSANRFSVANATLPSHAVPLGQLNSLLGTASPATETVTGVLAIATVGETELGAIDNKAVTPAKAKAVYVKKSQNLADIPNKATARTNLGLSDSATLPSSTWIRASNNLSDLQSATIARNNLGLGTASTYAVGDFLRSVNNLADVPNKASARANLGLTSVATSNPAGYLYKAENLAGLTSAATARANLGLSDSATLPSDTWMRGGNNLSEVSNVQAARNNLGLGNLSTRNVFGVVADLDFTASANGDFGYQKLPTGIIMQWGVVSLGGGSNEQSVTFNIPFPNFCGNIQLTNTENSPNEGNTVRVRSKTNTNFVLANGGGNSFTAYMWFAIGY
ncbi:tail fiber protein [Pseudomonas phage vB_PpuM-Roomu-2]|uniref:Tail fiber protein n=1 Tax=Pseudomonas phage vB_PpuM-Roomu-2 TaxID=3132621 RepID=A0AAX4MY68_9CAUD